MKPLFLRSLVTEMSLPSSITASSKEQLFSNWFLLLLEGFKNKPIIKVIWNISLLEDTVDQNDKIFNEK